MLDAAMVGAEAPTLRDCEDMPSAALSIAFLKTANYPLKVAIIECVKRTTVKNTKDVC